jgi:hypothetical protein
MGVANMEIEDLTNEEYKCEECYTKKATTRIVFSPKKDLVLCEACKHELSFITKSTPTFEYDIPINPGKEEIEPYNERFGTKLRTTEEHMEEFHDKIQEKIEEIGDDGGWYVGDGILVRAEIIYDPENK